MAVVYLEPEDEITGAVARVRAMPGGDVVIVVPAGSRIATSRINFRLLNREARERGLRLAVVSDEPAVRALATAAGLAAHDSVDGAEAALANEKPVDRPIESPPPDDATDVVPVVASGASTASATATANPAEPSAAIRPPRAGGRLSVEPPLYDVGERPRRKSRPVSSFLAPAVVVVLLLVLVGLGLYAAYVFVPTATVTLTPKLIDVGPKSIAVTADPRVAVLDASAGLIPASKIELPVEASDTFPATGTVVSTTAAHGTVRFSSKNTVFEVPVPGGTIVSTANGIEFETTDNATVPRANFDTHKAGTVETAVVAREKGTRGNVGAKQIRKLPASLSSALVSVSNPQPTTGGSRTEQAVVVQSDYDDAVTQLTAKLATTMATAIADPANTPRGLSLFAETARLGEAKPDQPASAVVDSQVDSFTLTVSATATVLAVNEDLVDQVAQAQLKQLVPAGTSLLPQTITTTHAPGVVGAQTVTFNASAVAKSWRSPDQAELLAKITGQTVSEARTIMELYGTVDISIWPDFIDRLPDQNRIRLVIVPPQETP